MAIAGISGVTGTSTDPTNSSSSTNSSNTMVNEQTFLQLLTAQLKNQDPMQPTDGVQFLSELAQFSQLEQLIGINQGVSTLDSAVSKTNNSNSNSGTPASGTTPTSGNNSN
ncbi:MAG TPA: flagellar hook capping FlgD N-terminal domain-containing protein [Bryobacteraceae bacterium]|nr:flagellar hook capping FlgD N-terminal domain-containing protein [Bryobacteraceae bacterium]